VVVLERYSPRPRLTGATARVARYAWSEDYHRVLGDRLAALADALVGLGATRGTTAPTSMPARCRAQLSSAGLGWMAKNTMLISRRHGSYTFISSVLTTSTSPSTLPAADHCGTCRACLDACPTGALPAARQLDARRCISPHDRTPRPFTDAEAR
jgi:epoxyqueuosine reductase